MRLGGAGKPRAVLQLGQRLLLAVGIGLPLRFEGCQGLGGVLGRHLDQLLLRPLVRHQDLHLVAAALCWLQPLADDLRLFHLAAAAAPAAGTLGAWS